MKPNAREVRRCEHCPGMIFFAVTKAGERQCLNAEPDPLGTVAAYRVDVRTWWCRTITSAAEADQVAHPLEERFRVHTCPRRPPAAEQGEIPGFDLSAARASSSPSSAGGVVVPFRRRPRT